MNYVWPKHVVLLSIVHRVAHQIHEKVVDVLRLEEPADHFEQRRGKLPASLANYSFEATREQPLGHFFKFTVLVRECVDSKRAAADHVGREFRGHFAAIHWLPAVRYFVEKVLQISRAFRDEGEYLFQLAGREHRRQFRPQWFPFLWLQEDKVLR